MELLYFLANTVKLNILSSTESPKCLPPTYNLTIQNNAVSLEDIEKLVQDQHNDLIYIILPSSHDPSFFMNQSLTVLACRKYQSVSHMVVCSSSLYQKSSTLQEIVHKLSTIVYDLPSQFTRGCSTEPFKKFTSYRHIDLLHHFSNPFEHRIVQNIEEHHAIFFCFKKEEEPKWVECVISTTEQTFPKFPYTYIFGYLHVYTKRPLSQLISNYQACKKLGIQVVDTGHDITQITGWLQSNLYDFSIRQRVDPFLINHLVIHSNCKIPNAKLISNLIRKLPSTKLFHTCYLDQTVLNNQELFGEHFYLCNSIQDSKLYILGEQDAKQKVTLASTIPCGETIEESTHPIVRANYFTEDLVHTDIADAIILYSCLYKGFEVYVPPEIVHDNVLTECFSNIQLHPLLTKFENPCKAVIERTTVPLVWRNKIFWEAEAILTSLLTTYHKQIAVALSIDKECNVKDLVQQTKTHFKGKQVLFLSNTESKLPEVHSLPKHLSKPTLLCLFSLCDGIVGCHNHFSWIASKMGKKKYECLV